MKVLGKSIQNRADGKVQRKRSRFALFRRSQSGVAAIEYAICAPVLLAMFFGIFEIGLTSVADRLLNAGVDSVARQIRTGEIRASGTYGMNEFKQELCDQNTMFLFDCNRLLVDVQVVAAFEDQSFDTNDDGSVNSDDFGFNPGGRTTINVVRAFYNWPNIINWQGWGGTVIGMEIDAFGEGQQIIMGSAAFMNEPFN